MFARGRELRLPFSPFDLRFPSIRIHFVVLGIECCLLRSLSLRTWPWSWSRVLRSRLPFPVRSELCIGVQNMRLLEALSPSFIRAGCAFSHTSSNMPRKTRSVPGREHHHYYYYPAAHECGHYGERSSWNWKGKHPSIESQHPGELLLLLRFRLKWLFTVEDLLNVRDAASLPLPSPPPRIPWYLPLKVGSVCSLALVLSVYLFSSIIKNTQAYTEPDREP